jgi:hypothetical protein
VPEHGKEKFLSRLQAEFNMAKAKHPNAAMQGLADGGSSNWNWLSERTDYQTLDFYYLSEYAGRAAAVPFKAREEEGRRGKKREEEGRRGLAERLAE